ncbi:DUF4815 domain-containing protein [Brucella pseudogrignonensis]|uniref:DUF4815 domain-containing protein n=1 Tax=Brucella pseudogrignonensis TaxID=419475 RepID=A0ABU1M642_9HYPH|nr:DUF4815 domain-containing protein [Brucella pseudogrignonensis]MDR6431307.1 hypothetical protein [Brucella pseudogrignonensis]
MAFEHESGLPYAYDRAAGKPDVKGVVFHGERPFVQGAELNEMQTTMRGVHDRVSRLVAKDGDRIERASAIVDRDAKSVTLTEGSIYVSGDVYPVGDAVLNDVPMTGRLEIGVRLNKGWLTHEDDPTLVGLIPGSLAEGEPGAARRVETISWALASDGKPGAFFAVYTLQDGTILDQTGPSMLEPVMQQLAIYDRPNGHYVVAGCRVTGLGANAGEQHFSIEQGEANISGFKRTRLAALRLAEKEEWDEGAIPGETHIYPGGASFTLKVDQSPIGVINSILLTKEKTVTITRGSISKGQDGLPDTSVIDIIEIPGFVKNTDYFRNGNTVDWGVLGGDEPTAGSSYQVTYRYRASVVEDAHTTDEITVSGGATGGDIIVSYTTRLPRIDRIGLFEDGSPAYIKGVSARSNPVAPIVPSDVLALATVTNNWVDRPVVVNDAVRSLPYSEMWRFFNRIVDHDRLIQLERIKSGIDAREPVAKKGMFVDGFADDTYRDAGIEQNAAIGNGMFQLAITPTVHTVNLAAPVMLNYSEEVISAQELRTGCVKINPYANFTVLPGSLSLNPAVDFWTVQQTEWLSAQTINLNMGTTRSGPLNVTTQNTQLVDQRNEQAEFLRQIPVSFEIEGFGAGEILKAMSFDDVSVMPVGEVRADANGKVTGSFVIPANVTAGTKTVTVEGQGGSNASAMFTGQGTIQTDVMRRVTTVQSWSLEAIRSSIVSGGSTGGSRGGDGGGRGGGADPQAQLFVPSEVRQVLGVDFHVCHIGDRNKHLLVEQVETDNGYPTTSVQAQRIVSMIGANAGWKAARFPLPVTTLPDRHSAFVIKTDDNEHSVSIAKLGDFDAINQKWISSHPYVIGPRFDSVNASTWTAHQDEALAFRIVAARFTANTKVVDLGTLALVRCSDLQIRATVELPSTACSVVFEIERSNGTIYRLLPYQLLELNEYLTETVRVRAVLTGTAKLSPILFAPVEIISGEIATEATYVSRAMALGTGVRLASYLKAYLPAGATVEMEYSIDGGDFTDLPLSETEQLSFPLWSERKFQATGLSGQNIRLKIKATGGPASRLVAGDFGTGVF